MDKFAQALQALLPTGFAWPRHPKSVLMRVLRGVAAAHAELYQFILATAAQWLPHRTTLRLREWEEACGLPDACFGPGQTEAERRAVLLARLRAGAAIDPIAAYRASGYRARVAALRPRHPDWITAVHDAKDWLTAALAEADRLDIGAGPGPVHHFHGWW